MIALIIFVLALLGFAVLALAARRHQNVLPPSFKRYRAIFKNGGFVLLLASLAVAIAQPRSSIMLVEWGFLLTAAGLPIVAAVTFAQFREPKRKNAR